MKPGLRESHAIALIVFCGLLHAILFIGSNALWFTNVEDLGTISGYLQNFTESLRSGNLYPRWMMQQFAGAGSPVFVYYSPLAFYIGSLFALPARFDPYAVYQLGLALAAGVTFSVLAAYIWLRQRATVATSTLIAVILFILPSQFLLMHYDVSLAMIWATVWFPLGLICLERWALRNDNRYLTGFSIVLFLIFFTHGPSALMFWPVLGLYALMLRPRIATCIALTCSYLLALALAGIYVVPLLTNWRAAQMDGYMHFITDYKAIFLSSYALFLYFVPQVMLHAMPFLILACVALFLNRRSVQKNSSRKQVLFAGYCVLPTGLLFTPLSAPLWEHWFYLKLLQAPYRLLTLLYVLSPLLLLGIKNHVRWFIFGILLCIALMPGAYMTWDDYAARRSMSHSLTTQATIRKALESRNVASVTAWMPGRTDPSYSDSLSHMPQADIVSGEGTLTVTRWQDAHIAIRLAAKTATILRIKQHYYPGWHTTTADDKPLALSPDAQGLMRLAVPAGTRDIRIDFDALPGAASGGLLSCASLLILFATWGVAHRRYRKLVPPEKEALTA